MPCCTAVRPARPQHPPPGAGCPTCAVGDARVGLVGFPSVGKSTLLTKLTGTFSEAAGYGGCGAGAAAARSRRLEGVLLRQWCLRLRASGERVQEAPQRWLAHRRCHTANR